MEFRFHGRGGQGAVTCAKLLASVYAGLGKSVQTFGDYSGERSGAPVRAYLRVSDAPIDVRNKVYAPGHVAVLDATLLDESAVAGLAVGGTLLVNTAAPPGELARRFPAFRLAAVDATGIARRHGIGTRSVVIVNTTIAGALARALGLPLAGLERVYHALGFASNLDAAREAFAQVLFSEASASLGSEAPVATLPAPAAVVDLVAHVTGAPTGLRTGSWRTQRPEYRRHLAPCSAFCPAGNDVVGFLQALAREGEDAAAAVLARTTPLPGVCGRVCPAPCMEGCNRREYDGAVNIRALERWVGDHARTPVHARPSPPSPRRFAVVGSGPAGLSAAFVLAGAGHRVVLFERERELGGVLRTGIPRYRLPREVLDREIGAILALGVEARTGASIDRVALDHLRAEFDAVIVASGLGRLRGLDGEGGGGALPGGVEQGIPFLARLNRGDAVALSGHVAVLGGGNTAMDCARSALRAGAREVTVVYRRTREEMPAIPDEIHEAEAEGVRFLFLRQPVSFVGAGSARGILLAEVELGPTDATGRRRPVVTGRTAELRCDHVLLALGQSAELGVLPAGAVVVDGRVRVGETPSTLFVAGDFATGDGTVTHAIGDGRRAATRALAALGLMDAAWERPDRALSVPLTDLRLDHFARVEGQRERCAPAAERRRGFDEVSRGLDDELEVHRCFSCGDCTQCDTCLVYCPEGIIRRTATGYDIDYAYCKGCGLCVAECPRRGMAMIS